jgi:hypothetical protein
MLLGVGALDLNFMRPDPNAVRYCNPSIASRLKRIDRVGNYDSPNSQIVPGDRVGDAVPHIVERLANDPGSPDSLLD